MQLKLKVSHALRKIPMKTSVLILCSLIGANTGFEHRSFVEGFTTFIALLMVSYVVLQTLINTKQKTVIKLKISDIDTMKGEEFEQYLIHFFLNKGYKVRTTPKSGDFGADLILEKDRKRIVVQAKRYKNKLEMELYRKSQRL
jgi:restriction system protein